MSRGWKCSLIAAGLVMACGGDESNTNPPGGDPPPGEDDPPPEVENRAAFVVDTMTIPTDNTTAQEFALDLDGDSVPDNKLGEVISTISSFADSFDVQAETDKALESGEIILLSDLGYTSFTAGDAIFGLYQGDNPSVEPCAGPGECGKHLQAGTEFSVTAASPRDNQIIGEVNNSFYSGRNGKISIPLPLAGSITTVSVIGAASEATVSKTDITEGILAGGVTEDEINSKLLPAIAGELGTLTEDLCTAEPSCECEGDAATIMSIFDSNDDCEISAQELQDNFLIQQLLKPDLDLLDENGKYNPNVDGELDSLSLGVGYTAINAVFDAP